jgi:hypothetical protein
LWTRRCRWPDAEDWLGGVVAVSEHLRSGPAIEVTRPWLDVDRDPVTRRLVFTGPQGASLNENPHTKRVWKSAPEAANIEYVLREAGMHRVCSHMMPDTEDRARQAVDEAHAAGVAQEWLKEAQDASYSTLRPR